MPIVAFPPFAGFSAEVKSLAFSTILVHRLLSVCAFHPQLEFRYGRKLDSNVSQRFLYKNLWASIVQWSKKSNGNVSPLCISTAWAISTLAALPKPKPKTLIIFFLSHDLNPGSTEGPTPIQPPLRVSPDLLSLSTALRLINLYLCRTTDQDKPRAQS